MDDVRQVKKGPWNEVGLMDDSTGKHWYSKELQAMILRERAETQKRLQAEALSRAKGTADFLKREYGVSKVILYGSLTDGFFHERSDIDILIEGFSGPFWEMHSAVDRLAEPFPLSIVCSEDADESLLKHVFDKGVPL